MSKHKKIRFIIHYIKPTAQLLFKIRFPKGGPTCRRQVVNPRHQTPQGQSVAKPETMYVCMYVCMYLLLLISMLWHRQAIFESKGDKLSSSAEGRIRTHQGLRHQIASRLNARWQTDWAIEDQANKLELDSPSLWSASIQPTRPHSRLAFAPGSGDIHVCCC